MAEIIDIIKNQALKEEAVTHRSYLNESDKNVRSNERLEFLGDAILEMVISVRLFEKFPNEPEGQLTRIRAEVVRTESLARIARKLNLGQYLRLSRGEEDHGGRKNESILANTVEAIIGAIFKDQGLESVSKFILDNLEPYIDEVIKQKSYEDPKSVLQELTQAQQGITPKYKVVKEEGPDHSKTFTVGVLIGEKIITYGTGKNKLTAETNAARLAIRQLKSLKQ